MGRNKKADPKDITLRPGPRVRHGGYSYLRTGKMPKEKAKVEKYLTWLRMTYIEDIAGEEENMTAGQTILLNKLILLEGLCRCIEIMVTEATERTGTFYNMPDKFLSYVNSIVKICGMLGIERREADDRIPTPLEIAAEFDREKEAEEREKAPEGPESPSKARRRKKP